MVNAYCVLFLRYIHCFSIFNTILIHFPQKIATDKWCLACIVPSVESNSIQLNDWYIADSMMACFNSILQWLAKRVAPIQLNCAHKIYCGNLVGFLVSLLSSFLFFGLGKMTWKDRNYFLFILSRNEFDNNVWAVFVVFLLFIFPYILWDVSYIMYMNVLIVIKYFRCSKYELIECMSAAHSMGEVLYGVIYTENAVLCIFLIFSHFYLNHLILFFKRTKCTIILYRPSPYRNPRLLLDQYVHKKAYIGFIILIYSHANLHPFIVPYNKKDKFHFPIQYPKKVIICEWTNSIKIRYHVKKSTQSKV